MSEDTCKADGRVFDTPLAHERFPRVRRCALRVRHRTLDGMLATATALDMPVRATGMHPECLNAPLFVSYQA